MGYGTTFGNPDDDGGFVAPVPKYRNPKHKYVVEVSGVMLELESYDTELYITACWRKAKKKGAVSFTDWFKKRSPHNIVRPFVLRKID